MAFPGALWDSTGCHSVHNAGLGVESESEQMPTVNNIAQTVEDSVAAAERLRLELERYRSELGECRKRMGELEQGEALLAGEKRILEMIAKSSLLEPILDALCRLVEEVSNGSLATILLLDSESNRLWHAAAPSLPSTYTEGMGGIVIGPSVGSCGTAAYRREPVIVCDIAADPLWADYRNVALAHGLRASWSTPIFSSSGNLLGTFAILSREPCSPTPQHHHITQQITHLASIAIERKRTEAALQESEERFRRMADAIPEVIWFTALEPEKVLYVSPSFERIWGLPVNKLYKNPRLWIEAIHPDDRQRVTSTFSHWVAGEQVNYHNVEYRIVQPDGAIRWIHERGVLSLNPEGKPCLASGISTDITERKRAEEELRRSEAYLAEAQKLSRTGSFGWNVSTGGITWSNETYCILGYDRAMKPNLELLLERVHPEDRALVQQMIDRATGGGTDLDFEHRVLMPDGMVKYVHVVARATKAESGAIEFVGALMDVTERKRAEVLVAGEKKLLEMIARGSSLASVLDALCRFGEEMSGNVLVSILLVSPDGKSLRHGAAPSLPKSYTEAIDGALIGPCAGSCGTAAYRGERIIVSDIATDPLWDQYRHLAIDHGLRACWSTPIFSTTRDVIGTFALYSREPGSPSSEQLNLIEQMTHLAAVAIERKCAEEALRRSESRFEGILAIAEDAIISIDSNQRILLFNQGAEKVFGYGKSEVIGKPLDVLLPQRFFHAHWGHIEAFTKSADVSRAMGQRRELFGIRKDGHEFPAEASISKLDLGGELIFTVILRDVTERKRAAEALRASEHLARGQVEALTSTLAALSQESEPEKLLEHVLEMMGRQLGAHSLAVWEMNGNTGRVQIVVNCEDGRLNLATREEVQATPQLSLTTQYHPIWTEFFRTGAHCVIGNMESDTVRVRIAEIPDSLWYDWSSDVVVNPTSQAVVKRLHSSGIVATLAVPTFVAGKVTGLISIRFKQQRSFRPEEIELTRALTHQAMVAIRLIRLSQQSRQTAVIAERNRMARDIHDTLAQGFTGVIVQLEAAGDATSKGLAKETEEHLRRAGDLARESLKEARRSVRALRPQALDEKNLCQALEDLLRKMTAGTTLPAEFNVQGQPRSLPPEWEENILRICQEVLTNALRHAHASQFKAQLLFVPSAVRLDLCDNGCGFDPAGKHDGFGLMGMRERVEGMGGKITIHSATGKGTAILIVLPLATDSIEPRMNADKHG